MNYEQDKVWISAEHLEGSEELTEESKNEFFELPVLSNKNDDNEEDTSLGSSRRDFLKYLGFSVGAATVAASCDTPLRKALPYVTKPDSIVPGVATYYASNYFRSGSFCPVLVKTREGRPIKIEGNMLSSKTEGATTARVQASVLDLYDTSRFSHPGKVNEDLSVEPMTWSDIDKEIGDKLASSSGIRLVSHTIISPTTKSVVDKFIAKYPNTKHVTYDPVSSSALVNVHEELTGERGVPGYDFSKADTIVSIGADFLGTWIAPAVFTKQFSKGRKVDVHHPKMNHLVAVETNMSLTGSNADDRIQIRPSEQGAFIQALANAVLSAKGGSNPFSGESPQSIDERAKEVANLLLKSITSIVVSDSNNEAEQLLVAAINQALGNYGSTITDDTIYARQGSDSELKVLAEELSSGSADALLFLEDANPVYDSPYGSVFKEGIKGASLSVSLGYSPNETFAVCQYVCPTDHYLESWSDVQFSKNSFGLVQPTINRLFNTRAYQESLMTWSGQLDDTAAGRPFMNAVKNYWESEVFPKQSGFGSFMSFWESSLRDGILEMDSTEGSSLSIGSIEAKGRKITTVSNSEIELKVFEPIGVGNGSHANNPWLQEMPDPITRVVWDNPLQIPIKWEGGKAFKVFKDFAEDGQYAKVSIGDEARRLAVVKQFGQASGAVSVALGYGREVSGRAAQGVGVNVYNCLSADEEGNIQYFVANVTVDKLNAKDKEFASVQHHHTLGVTGEVADGKVENVDEKTVMDVRFGDKMNFQGGLTNRTIIRQSNLDDLAHSVEHLKHEREHIAHLNETSIYEGHDEAYATGHHWGMAIDLASCIGCGACQVACVAENNVPVVGKKEVNRHHEMTWLRIDRYYYGDANNPNVVYQPMMCQHCDNAPCENVCPVAATPHSSEGLNQMTYNRCVGTRYCANNCPYKVRRFNWLDYTTADTFPANENNPVDGGDPFYSSNLVRMVLNPDVTVRSRGVIEKCSMCVQRIQEGKLRAKTERRPLMDGDIQTACQTACPTGGIVFGDMNDENSELMKMLNSERNYYALEEVNVRPSIGYQMKVTNKKLSELHVHHGQDGSFGSNHHSEGHDHGHDHGEGGHH